MGRRIAMLAVAVWMAIGVFAAPLASAVPERSLGLRIEAPSDDEASTVLVRESRRSSSLLDVMRARGIVRSALGRSPSEAEVRSSSRKAEIVESTAVSFHPRLLFPPRAGDGAIDAH